MGNVGISEINISKKLYQLIKKTDNFAIISPFRSENTLLVNKTNMKNLMDFMKKKKYRFIHLSSKWVEYSQLEKKNVVSSEESLLILDITKEKALKIGKHFNQSSIIAKYDNIVAEICTTPFSYQTIDTIKNYKENEIVKVFDLDESDFLLSTNAQLIYDGKLIGACSKAKAGGLPFTFTEAIEFDLYDSCEHVYDDEKYCD